MLRIWLALACVLCLFDPKAASAWGYQGHEVVGSIAGQASTREGQSGGRYRPRLRSART